MDMDIDLDIRHDLEKNTSKNTLYVIKLFFIDISLKFAIDISKPLWFKL